MRDQVRSPRFRHGSRGASAERALVWMLGSPRTRSTWLVNVLTFHERVVPINELAIGYHLWSPAWRENLTAEEQGAINETLGDALVKYGYEVTAPKP